MRRLLLAGGAIALLASSISGCASPEPSACRSAVSVDELPTWARGGFSEGAAVPHVIGDRGRIVAVLFSQPLIAVDPDAPPQNKVLLVPREVPQVPAPVLIEARLDGADLVVQRVRQDGPGPGVLDLPQAGCWHLALRWAGESDTLDLEYQDQDSSFGP